MQSAKPNPESSTPADADIDALIAAALAADSPQALQSALQPLELVPRESALAAVARAEARLAPNDTLDRQRVFTLQGILSGANPMPDLGGLPPQELYDLVLAGNLTPAEAGEIWKRKWQGGEWEIGWLRAYDASIGSQARPDGDPKLVTIAQIQVEAARAIDDLELRAMTLTTLGGVTIQVTRRVAEGLLMELEALRILRSYDRPAREYYAHVVCTNLSRLMGAARHYADVSAMRVLLATTFETLLPLASAINDPSCCAAAFEALAAGVSEAAIVGDQRAAGWAGATASVPWRGFEVRTGVVGAALALSVHVPLNHLEKTLAIARDVSEMLGIDDRHRQLQLEVALLTIRRIGTADEDLKEPSTHKLLIDVLERLNTWLTEFEGTAPSREVGLACMCWSQAQNWVHPNDDQVLKRLEIAASLLLQSGDAEGYRVTLDLLGDWCGRNGYFKRARSSLCPSGWNKVAIAADGSIDMSLIVARVGGIYQYCLKRFTAGVDDPQLVGREIIELLEPSWKAVWHPKLRIACAKLLVHFRSQTHFINADQVFKNRSAMLNLLTTLNEPGSEDPDIVADYWETQADGWQFLASDKKNVTTDAARARMLHAVSALEQLGRTYQAAMWRLRYAWEMGPSDLQTALEFLSAAAPACTDLEVSMPWLAVEYYNTSALLARLNGDLEKSLADSKHASELCMRAPFDSIKWTAKLPQANRAHLLIELGRWEEAHENLQEAIELEERQRAQYSAGSRDSQLSPFESNLAISSAFNNPIYSDMSLVCFRTGRSEDAFAWSERSRAANLRRQLATRDQRTRDDVVVSKPQQVRELFGSRRDWAFVQYLVRQSETLAFIVTSEQLEVLELPGLTGLTDLIKQRVELAESATGRRESLEPDQRHAGDRPRPFDRVLRDLGGEICQMLLKPLLAVINEEIRNLIISGSAGLENLPWNTAWWQEETQIVYLVDRFSLRKVPSASVLSRMLSRRETPGSALVVVGDHPELPFSFVEARAVAQSLESWMTTVTMLETSGSASALEACRNTSHCHITCHGDFDDADPLKTRLVLGSDDGDIVRMADIANAIFESNCSVVLSACETGMIMLDRGSEHLGLPSALALAGASWVLGAAWAVEDLPSALLMIAFYERWQHESGDPAVALAHAQRFLRDRRASEIACDVEALMKQHGDRAASRVRLMQARNRMRQLPSDSRPFESPEFWAAFEIFG